MIFGSVVPIDNQSIDHLETVGVAGIVHVISCHAIYWLKVGSTLSTWFYFLLYIWMQRPGNVWVFFFFTLLLFVNVQPFLFFYLNATEIVIFFTFFFKNSLSSWADLSPHLLSSS